MSIPVTSAQNAKNITATTTVYTGTGGLFGIFVASTSGGTLKVSQIQLLQPFLSILAAIPLLGESLDLVTVGFALAVVATVFIGKRFASGAPPVPQGKTP